MKKGIFVVCFLMISVLLASCGRAGGGGVDTVSDPSSEAYRSEDGNGEMAESGIDAPGAGEQPEAGGGMSNEGNSAVERETKDEQGLKELAASQAEETEMEETEEAVFLSDKILKEGDTLEVLDYPDKTTMDVGLEITLQSAGIFGSPEEAKLDRSRMEKKTENYDLTGNPVFCDIDETEILTCNLTVKNVNEPEDGLHIAGIMIAYVDPDTQKVSILSCMPAYFSASSSRAGASDYYHYAIPKGESKEITVAWLIPEEYEAENLYLGVTYDIREPEERQYFRLFEE